MPKRRVPVATQNIPDEYLRALGMINLGKLEEIFDFIQV